MSAQEETGRGRFGNSAWGRLGWALLPILVTAGILAVLPPIWFGDSRYTTSLAVQALVFAAYGVGFNLIFGSTNQLFLCVGALAGIVAMTQSMGGPLGVNAGFELTTFALIVTVVGGLGSVAGAFLAGVLLGVVQSLSAHYIGQYITTIILLGVAALTILIRPRGLLGR